MRLFRFSIFLYSLICVPCLGQWQTGVKPPLGTQIDWSDPINRGLVGYWLMNEGAGTRVNDLSGNGRVGTITAATWAAGTNGPCLSFDGNADYVTISSPLMTSSTVVMRVKADSLKTWNFLFATSVGGYCAVNVDGNFQIAYKNGASAWEYTIATGATVIPFAGVWYHLAFVFTVNGGAVNLSSYRDGVKLTNRDDADGITEQSITTISTNTTNALAGKIDYFKVYNRALTASEIARLYREPFAGMVREPIEVWAGVSGEPSTGKPQVITVIMAGIPAWVVLTMVIACVREKLAMTHSSNNESFHG